MTQARSTPPAATRARQRAAGGAGPQDGTKPNALAALVRPSPELARVVGADPLPRTEVTKRLWAYIKTAGLQNPANRREVVADETLRPLFDGAERVDMMRMTALVAKHVTKA